MSKTRSGISIAKLMTLIAMLAVILAIIAQFPCVGLLLAIPLSVASLGAAFATKGRGGRDPTVLDHVWTFFAAFSVMCTLFGAPVMACMMIVLVVASVPADMDRRPWGTVFTIIGVAIVTMAIAVGVCLAFVRLRDGPRPKPPEPERGDVEG